MASPLIINDGNYKKFCGHSSTKLEDGTEVDVHHHGTEKILLSCLPRPAGAKAFATPFKSSTIDAGFGAGVTIPKSEWQSRIEEMEKLKSRVSDHIDFPQYTQNGLPYCWTNSSTQAAATQRRIQGGKYVQFSAASVGAPVSGYRSVGGWGGESLKYLVSNGAVDVKYWGNNAIDRSLDTPETRANREHHRVLEFIECESTDEEITCALLGMPTICDYSWWSHSTMGCDPVWLDNDIAKRNRNSWLPWGDTNQYGVDGFYILQGRKMQTDGCWAVRQVTLSQL